MGTIIPIFLLILAYLSGSVPYGYLIGKLRGKDIRNFGSHNIGATNVTRTLGRGYGLLVFFLDFMKSGIFIILTKFILNYQDDFFTLHIHPLVYGTLAFFGHIFPIFLKFKGGKGISTFGGIIVFYDWRIALGGFIVFVLVAIISKYISMASSIGTFSTIIFCLIINRSDYYLLIFLTIVFVTITIKHIPNYKRLCKKEESRITILDHKHHKTN